MVHITVSTDTTKHKIGVFCHAVAFSFAVVSFYLETWYEGKEAKHMLPRLVSITSERDIIRHWKLSRSK